MALKVRAQKKKMRIYYAFSLPIYYVIFFQEAYLAYNLLKKICFFGFIEFVPQFRSWHKN